MNNDYHTLVAKWYIHVEESDIPDSQVRFRFSNIQVEQRKRLGSTPWINGDIITWFKSRRTQTFTHNTKDSQKKMVIQLVEKFLLDLNDPLIHNYELEQTNTYA